jgi:hypothetical protein
MIEPSASSSSSAGRRFVRVLTTIHAVGGVVLFAMASYLLAGGDAERLAGSPGARLLVDSLGPWLPSFLGGLGAFLVALAWGSSRRMRWARSAALVAYSIGVAGSLWQVSTGIARAWVSFAVNAGVVALLASRAVRDAYRAKDPPR